LPSNSCVDRGKPSFTYDREITVLRETEESARVIVNNEERLVGKKDIGVYDINVVNVGEFRCNARDNHYVSNVTVRLVGREYIKRRGVERSFALVAGPDVSAMSIDM